MEETKYYTPAPDDLRIGFEFEIMTVQGYGKRESKWQNHQFSEKEDIRHILPMISAGGVRVPHLTADQIEA